MRNEVLPMERISGVGLEYMEGMRACKSRRKAQNWKAKFAFFIILI